MPKSVTMVNRDRKIVIGNLIFITVIGGLIAFQMMRSSFNELTGKWRSVDNNFPLVLHFKANGEFEVDANRDNRADITGTYELNDSRLKLTDNDAGTTTDCFDPGFYAVYIENGKLAFELYNDDCRPRREGLAKPFRKKWF